jgi:ethanolamine utilization protein EutA
MNDIVQLVGLDFGTTTSSALAAQARLRRNAVTGRTDLDDFHETFRSELVFTPLVDGKLDEARLERHLDDWFAAGDIRPEHVFGGGALLTGLTALRGNADAITRLVRRRVRDALVAGANDPHLESWLSYQGSCAGLARAHPDRSFLNIDIGGGTSNFALGRAGEVIRTDFLFVGARHVQVQPGSYRVVGLSEHARQALETLGVHKEIGHELSAAEVDRYLQANLELLRTTAEQIAGEANPIITFSGGVGELIYRHARGEDWPPMTCYGDLGIDLAKKILESATLTKDVRAFQPATAGRATAYGLLRHSTLISGNTVFLAAPERLPLANIPILGTLASESGDLDQMLDWIARSPVGGCLRVEVGASGDAVRRLGTRIGEAVDKRRFSSDHPLVLLVRENIGKLLGEYVTAWGARPLHLLVIDELDIRAAQFVHVGALRDRVLPVSFFGMNEGEPKP